MAKVIPSNIDQKNTRLDGERMVFEWFSKDNIPGTVYYSLLQKNHRHKLIGEVDFLYVSDRGFLCIEVKGGQQIYCADKQWHSVNKKGVDIEIKNPFKQAKDCQYALKDYFRSTFGNYSEQSQYLIGYAVVFPECRFTGSGNDLVTEVMFDGRYNVDDFSVFLERAFDYWESQERDKHNRIVKKLTKDQLTQANDLLRGDFRVVPSLRLEFQHVSQQIIELTDEQYDALDIADDNSKVIIKGAAGTGKTLLALEMARRYAARQSKVLYLCFNSNMADYAASNLHDAKNVHVTTFHKLMSSALDRNKDDYSDIETLSKEYLSQKIKSEQKYDAVVIDEGQDLLNIYAIDAIDSFLKDGINDCKWVMFMDPNQNIFNHNRDYDETLEYIRELFAPAVFTLKTNCRNTEQIARRTAAVTQVRPAKHLRISGPKVVNTVYKDKKDFIRVFKAEVLKLLQSGVSPVDIVILSRYRKDNSLLADIDNLCNLQLKQIHHLGEVKRNWLSYYTVQSFKGLESKVVMCVDMEGFLSDTDRMLNYVAMSRAQLLLYTFIPEDKEEEYEEAIDRGYDLFY